MIHEPNPNAPDAPAPPALTAEDAEHLRLLSIFHYVVGGIAALVALIPMVHVGLGIAMAFGAAGDDPGAAFVGCFFAAIGLSILGAAGAYAAAMILAARALAERRRYTFCLVMAAISCAFTPFGTVLGIFTLVVLLRPGVKASFAGAPGTTPVAG